MKRYIGDGVFVDYEADGFSGRLVLTAENGFDTTDTIVLEPDVYRALLKYASDVWRVQQAEAES